MQIIIDISEDLYLAVRNGLDADEVWDLRGAVTNGALLQKRHGRLIDADKVIEEATEMMKYSKNHTYMECVIAHMNLAPTIVEAESEG